MRPDMRLTLMTAAAVGVVVWCAPEAPSAISNLTSSVFPTVLESVASLTLLAVGGWMAAIGALAHAGPWGRRLAIELTPRLFRAAVIGLLGGAVALSPAGAAESGGRLDGLTLPDRPWTSSALIPTTDVDTGVHPTRDEPSVDRSRSVEVRSGDTLWSLAREHLGPDAQSSQIAAAVRRLHHDNADVIGADPDLIVPGQRLTLTEETS